MHQIITISGDPGSGKSTIAKELARKLSASGGKAKRIYVGEIRREIARQKGLTLAELNSYAENHPETDVDIDKQIAAKARQLAKKYPVIVEGRTQFYFIPESFKLYIKVSITEGAKRIWQQIQSQKAKSARNEGKINSLAQVKKSIKKRVASDKKRYQKYYGIDHTKKSHYDYVIDTTRITALQATNKILKKLKA
ncbi:MAG: cytidylate kinase family protein [Candidatus Parcubacteria bacterium]|nr:cytidylate kinase family protein [Candidatus Parcubacteria bacterium]